LAKGPEASNTPRDPEGCRIAFEHLVRQKGEKRIGWMLAMLRGENMKRMSQREHPF
jgi:hypothetical protein